MLNFCYFAVLRKENLKKLFTNKKKYDIITATWSFGHKMYVCSVCGVSPRGAHLPLAVRAQKKY